jgi:hypothetical protein
MGYRIILCLLLIFYSIYSFFEQAVSVSGFLHYVALIGVLDITDLPVTFRYSAARQLNRMKCELDPSIVQWTRVSDKTVTEVFMYDVINKQGFSLAIGHLEESRLT